MRTRPFGSVAALIVAIVLVAMTGPAAARAPGPAAEPPGSSHPIDLDGLSAAMAIIPTQIPPRPVVAPASGRRPAATLPKARAVPARAAPRWRLAGYSWYGPGLYGNGTACGQEMTRSLLGVAHRSLPCGTRVTLRNLETGHSITVRVVDRGPYVSGRLWDLTRATCAALDACFTGRIGWRLP